MQKNGNRGQNRMPRYIEVSDTSVEASAIGNKTGAEDDVRNDVALVFAKSGPIVISAFTWDNKDQRWSCDNQAQELIARMAQPVVTAWTRNGTKAVPKVSVNLSCFSNKAPDFGFIYNTMHLRPAGRRTLMRAFAMVLLLSAALAAAQTGMPNTAPQPPKEPALQPASVSQPQEKAESQPGTVVLPAGTKVPLKLTQAISTKNARAGDNVYAETTFPITVDNRMAIPPGTYVQGKISSVQRAGRVKGRAELHIHFTSLIFPSGYTLMLPGAVDQVPGAEHAAIKDKEGTIQAEGKGGKTAASAAEYGATGAVVGGLSRGGKGALVGGGIGAAAGLAIATLTRNTEVRMEPGTTLEMILQRPLELNEAKLR